MPKSRVFIRSARERSVAEAVHEVMTLCNWEAIVPPGARVVLKPNLCTPSAEIIEVANTSPEVLSAICAMLKTRTDNVVIGESDGVRYTAEEAFVMNGTIELAKRFGFEVKSFSKDTLVDVGHPHLKGWGLPKTILDCDVFMTTAKFKTHATTAFTGALKNQWGCVPQHDRLVLHKYLHTLIGDVNTILKPKLAIMDGMLAMEGRGPINGVTVRLGVIAGGTDLVAVDSACMRFVGLDPKTARHIVHASRTKLGTMEESEIEVDADCEPVKLFIPADADWPIRAMNLITKSEFLTRSLLLNDHIFYPARWFANLCRRAKAKVLGGEQQDRRLT
jgi:uncharacterized protein (DUF362 family)